MSLQIWSYEGEVIVNLVDGTTEDDLDKRGLEVLTEEQYAVWRDQPFEGHVVEDNEDITGLEVRNMTVDGYLDDIREFANSCLFEG